MSRQREPKAIGLFAGAGGLDIGLEAAGFRIALAVERDPVCCETLRANHTWVVVEKDIRETTPSELLKAGKLRKRQVDLIAAGPPCQPFSKSANWVPNGILHLDDTRAAVLHNLLDIIGYILPRCVLVENVDGFRRDGLPFLLEGFQKINAYSGTKYRPVFAILNAADYGVPQMRRRLFLVAFRDGRDFAFPESTHADSHVTCWDAIGGLSKRKRKDLAPKGRWAKLLPSIPEGWNYQWHTNRGGGKQLFGWRTNSTASRRASIGRLWSHGLTTRAAQEDSGERDRQLSSDGRDRVLDMPLGSDRRRLGVWDGWKVEVFRGAGVLRGEGPLVRG